jgi:tetratricopeptide (TPR) repeat protein
VSDIALKLANLINTAHAANEQKEFSKAKRLCEKALKINHRIPEVWYNLGIALRGLNERDAAKRAQFNALNLTTSSADAQNNIGLELLQLKAYDDAKLAFERSITLAPESSTALSNLAKLLHETGRNEQALAIASRALKTAPNSPAVLINIGGILNSLHRHNEAKTALLRAIKIEPRSAQALFNLGNSLNALQERTTARQRYQEALLLKPDYADALNNLGVSFLEENQYNEALAYLDKAKKIAPNQSDILINIARVFAVTEEPDKAEKYLKQVIKRSPEHAEAHLNLAHLLFSQCRFKEGWQHHQYRFNTTLPIPINWSPNAKKIWGQINNSENVLIVAEQGIGDEVLHASLIPLLQQQPAPPKVTLSADPRLFPIYERSFPRINLIDRHSDIEDTSASKQIALASLGADFIENCSFFSKTRSPYLKFNEKLTEDIRRKINPKKNSLICGIAWDSKNKKIGSAKSLRLDLLAPILDSGRILPVSLQYGDTDSDISQFELNHNIKIERASTIDKTNDLDSLLSLIAACDLVITVSNSTAHLAGALNKTTYLLSARGNGKLWYWHNQDNTGHSLWYPSVKILEQEEIGNWSAPITKLKTILENH